MRFTKMHGIGNDYVYVDCTKTELQDPAEIARFVSNRHFGIGSDGLILIKSSDVADFEMEMYNADGSRGKMCGNGIRCVGKYVYDHGMTDKTVVKIATGAGIKTLTLTVKDGKAEQIRVDMGGAILEASAIPTTLTDASGKTAILAPIEILTHNLIGIAVTVRFLVCLIHYVYAPTVAKLIEVWIIGIVTGTQEVHVSLLHQHYILLVGLAVNISACNGMMIMTVHTTQLDILTIEFQYLTNTFHSLHSKMIVEMLVWQFDTERIEVRNISRPEFRIVYSMR